MHENLGLCDLHQGINQLNLVVGNLINITSVTSSTYWYVTASKTSIINQGERVRVVISIRCGAMRPSFVNQPIKSRVLWPQSRNPLVESGARWPPSGNPPVKSMIMWPRSGNPSVKSGARWPRSGNPSIKSVAR